MDRHEPGGYWFRLSEYSDMDELYAAFGHCYHDEKAPVFRFREWSDIPDELVREDWLAPDLFEALDAMNGIDEDECENFLRWCRLNGLDLSSDDVAELIFRYGAERSMPEEEPPDEKDSPYASDYRSDRRKYSTELFGDDYD